MTAPVSEEKLSLRERLRNPERWRQAVLDLALWFIAGIILTTVIARMLPGHPILVGTPSIDTGIYWLNKRAAHFQPGDFVTFPFAPGPNFAWLTERYGDDRIHTKMVRGVGGDKVFADDKGRLRICRRHDLNLCVDAGMPQAADSLGRDMPAWVPPNHEYTLKHNELWIYGPNERSLDSRYYGPIVRDAARGKAIPLWLWGERQFSDPMHYVVK